LLPWWHSTPDVERQAAAVVREGIQVSHMNSRIRLLAALVIFAGWTWLTQAAPLRVFIRAGAKTHGPNQHDHPRFLGDWTKLLGERGLQVAGSMNFPTAAELDATDVLVIYAQDGMKIAGEERTRFESFLSRGGGVVVLHDGIVAGDEADWCKATIGGTWRWQGDRKTEWHEGDVGLYFVNPTHPIVRGVSNFDWKDEVYNKLDTLPDITVLAQSFIDVFNIWPQMWTYERTATGGSKPYRAFVSVPGHEYDVFNTPHYRAMLLRGIAWAGRRDNTDEFVLPAELASLKYPAGGPLPAPQALTKMDAHPEFDVSLVADENVAEKIMSLDWDPAGRLWIIETPEYPGGRTINKNDRLVARWSIENPGRPIPGELDARTPRDRVSILEDTNADGVMDKKTVFADGLELPTSVVFYKDGVIVSQAPDILWIRDTDGDGKADKREVLYTGWGTFDTHAVINNFRWGMDGWIYGVVGYTKGDVKSGDGTKSFGRIVDGAFRFRPDGSALEQFSANACNTWGLEIAPDNEVVYTTATCGNPILHVVMPEKTLARGNVGGVTAWKNVISENRIYPPFKETRQPYVQIDWVNQWTAAAGATIYDGGAWPAKWNPEDRYSFFMSEATMHLFHHEFLDHAGPSYQGRKEEGRQDKEFLTGGQDYWFRPIHSRVGPDGAIYLVDFYNQIAVHNDTRGPAHGARNAAARPDRDHHFTRLYRIQHKKAKALPAFQLKGASAEKLIEMLGHPNGWVRLTANRLLTENPDTLDAVQSELGRLITDAEAPAYARIQALWLYNTLARTHEVGWDETSARSVLNDTSALVRKNAVRVSAELNGNPRVRSSGASPAKVHEEVLIERLRDTDERVRIQALMAVGALEPSKDLAAAVVSVWPSLKDKWSQSAAVGAAADAPLLYVEASFAARDPAFLADYVPHLARLVANRGDAALASKLVALLARQPAATDGLKTAALEALAAGLPRDVKPAVDAGLLESLRALLASPRAAGATLPFVARWEATSALAAEMKPAIARATAALADTSLPDAARGQTAMNLVALRGEDASILPALSGLLGGDVSAGLQKRVIEALGSASEGGLALIPVFGKLKGDLTENAFSQVLKRPETARAFVEALASKQLDASALGPARLHRLRTYNDEAVAKRADQVIDELRGPEAKEKDALIAKLSPEVTQAGDLVNGKNLYAANCAGCHQFKGEGRNLAPNLTGMGAHGPQDLLIHIVDPNRVVEANFLAYSIETKSGDTYDGVIERENDAEVFLRDAAQDHTIRVSDIKTRRSTGRSLMPEGFEALGAAGLRDLLSYLCADENRFRIVDLTKAFTASNSRGIYAGPDDVDGTVRFNRYGLRRVEDVPFDVISPDKVGANVVVLRGGAPGSWSRRTLPQKVEVKVGLGAARLHFLGGVAGWGYPAVREQIDAARVTLVFADGSKQEILLKNGVEIADYNGRPDVPGSKPLNWTVGRGQVRWFSRDVTQPKVIDRLIIESFDNNVAPTFFAITAETAEAHGSAAAPAAATSAIKVVAVGGNQHHDFQRFFNLADKETLERGGLAQVTYTEDQSAMVAALRDSSVLVASFNQSVTNAAVREALMNFAAAGRGLVFLHAANWYAQTDGAKWPEYNQAFIGGGSRGHDKFGDFPVTVTDAAHPVTAGVPAQFQIRDELYYHQIDPASKARVLATARSPVSGKEFPQVWITDHPKARIVNITFGHDGMAHSHEAYQALLRNAVAWTARQTGGAQASAK
jgi:uncharacterized protein